MKNKKELTHSTQGQASEPKQPSSILVNVDLSNHPVIQDLKKLLQAASTQLDDLQKTLEEIETYRPKI